MHKIIAIAEGHNTPHDMGAKYIDVGADEYLVEFFENRLVASYAMYELYKMGYEIEDFTGHLIREKIPFINDTKAGICVEIHHNANRSETIRGSEIIYHPNSEKGKKLAQCLSNSVKVAGFKCRGTFEGWYRYDKSLNKIFALLSRTRVAACIVERNYLTNFYDRQELTPDKAKDFGIAIAEGVHKYDEEN